MEKKILRESIQDIDNIPILYGIDMMDPLYKIDKIKAYIIKCDKNMKRKHNVK